MDSEQKSRRALLKTGAALAGGITLGAVGKANAEAFDRAVAESAHITGHLLEDLVSAAPPKDREVEAAKAKERSARRFAAA